MEFYCIIYMYICHSLRGEKVRMDIRLNVLLLYVRFISGHYIYPSYEEDAGYSTHLRP